ncbi:MAG TPA: SDR family oxidoreductase, partial [Anaerolineales bacterium]|nr:SDR family oxidoreductase [Anaerolineales bacterium]
VLDVNLTGAFLMTQSAGRVMRLRGSGVIVTLIHRTAPLVTGSARDESSARVEPRRNEAAFVASMQGLAAFTHQAARELNPYGIQVHLVDNVPGNVVASVFALLDPQVEEH